MEPQEIEAWKKTSQKGVFRYILKYGTLLAFGYAFLCWSSLAHKITGLDLIGIAITSVVGGIMMSLIFWFRKEIPYQHWRERQHHK